MSALSVVVAVHHASANLADIMQALQPELHPAVEFLFCVQAAEPGVKKITAGPGNVRVLHAAGAALIPHLWRDGIRAAQGERVATTTAACIPAPGWVERLEEADLEGCAGIGGIIDNHPASDAKGWAIYFLRYARLARPGRLRDVEEIAADNALYRRAELLRETDLLAEGFWEPSFHRRLRARGLELHLDPELRVVHRNRYSVVEFCRQRMSHGRAFSRARADALGLPGRLLFVVASPVVPAVLLGKVVGSAWGKQALRRPLLRALPWLALFVLAWALGEARGYGESLVGGVAK